MSVSDDLRTIADDIEGHIAISPSYVRALSYTADRELALAKKEALAPVTQEEADEIDRWMGEHMYHHSISNNINGMGCDASCRTNALQAAVNRLFTARITKIAKEIS